MESLVRLSVLWILFSGEAFAAKVAHYNEIFGHIHRRPSRSAESLASIECGHPLKVRAQEKKGHQDWVYVKSGGYEGYVLKGLLSEKAPPCFQKRYPKFMDMLNLSTAQHYYWGRLYSKYVYGVKKAERP